MTTFLRIAARIRTRSDLRLVFQRASAARLDLICPALINELPSSRRVMSSTTAASSASTVSVLEENPRLWARMAVRKKALSRTSLNETSKGHNDPPHLRNLFVDVCAIQHPLPSEPSPVRDQLLLDVTTLEPADIAPFADTFPLLTNFALQVMQLYKRYGSDSAVIIKVGPFAEMYGDQAIRWGHALGHHVSCDKTLCFPWADAEALATKLVQEHRVRVALIEELSSATNVAQLRSMVPFPTTMPGATRGLTRYLGRLFTPGTIAPPGADVVAPLAVVFPHAPPGAVMGPTTPISLAVCDTASRFVGLSKASVAGLRSMLSELGVAEVLIPEELSDCGVQLTAHTGQQQQQRFFNLFSKATLVSTRPLGDFTDDVPGDLQAKLDDLQLSIDASVAVSDPTARDISSPLRALIRYLDFVYSGSVPSLISTNDAATVTARRAMFDQTSVMHLEIEETLMTRSKRKTLVACLDKTMTKSGRKALARDLKNPLMDRVELEARLDRVDVLRSDAVLGMGVRRIMELASKKENLPLFERIVSDIAGEKAMYQDLCDLARYLAACHALVAVVDSIAAFHDLVSALRIDPNILHTLQSTLVLDGQSAWRFRTGVDSVFDAHMVKIRASQAACDSVKRELLAEFGIPTSSAVIPLFLPSCPIDSASGQHRKPSLAADPLPTIEFAREQFLAIPVAVRASMVKEDVTSTVVRATHPKWTTVQGHYEQLEEDLVAHEEVLLHRLVRVLRPFVPQLRRCAHALGTFDWLQGVAQIQMHDRTWARPTFSETSALLVRGAVHPVMASVLRREGRTPIPRDCDLDREKRMIIVTGTNMGGKTSLLRTVGALAVLAQAGIAVTAQSFSLPIFDGIFTRFGSHDDQAKDASTFKLEVMEMATIFDKATSQSLVLIDEFGRGTSYPDGLAILTGVIRGCLELGAMTMVTTHLHGLEKLLERHIPAHYFDQIVFLQAEMLLDHVNVVPAESMDYELRPGAAAHSRGVEVTGLCGIDSVVVERAMQVRSTLEVQAHVVTK
ncbi:hypothetical protein AMAG_08814 [Allomyces macrogynus ATCC 38327]|uniref:DNA mismatch repair proteins mutS family domain-containing protein n=1 Tax=Allomyces macrogynus (strain ATCC 38327) TaxID=578462 RepID=A0A0L0SML3_ALLM3|nr:hypothetical protein AMAG_08814 [Allomyces macrogynus ATCC 38327]|eukprot:KNE63727.1 hypothetical protein AMAG_08814 [Allomyces macrogynus ATCC 38327]